MIQVFSYSSLISALIFVTATVANAGSIQMSRTPDKQFFAVRLVFNDRNPTLMLVDTGASESIMTDWFAKDAGIAAVESKEETADSAGKPFKVFRGQVQSVQIATRKESNLNLAIVNFPAFKKADGVAGLFSPQSFFANEPLLIDFPAARLAWGQDASAGGKKLLVSLSFRDCEPSERGPFILVKINGVEAKFLLDTGGFKSAVTRSLAKKLGSLPTRKSKRNGITGPRTLESLEKLRVELNQVRGQIDADIEDHVNGCPIADGKFGIDWLSKYAVLLSADRKTVAFYR